MLDLRHLPGWAGATSQAACLDSLRRGGGRPLEVSGSLPFDLAKARIGHWIFGKSSANLRIQLLVWGLTLGGVEL